MATTNKIWLVFSYDEYHNDYTPLSIQFSLDGVMKYINSLKFSPPYLTHYRFCPIDLKDTIAIKYDDGKILIDL